MSQSLKSKTDRGNKAPDNRNDIGPWTWDIGLHYLNHSAKAESLTTIVCERSGPVEIKPICTPI